MKQQKKYDVFISYSRKDSAVADKICSAFDQVGITYFIDRRGIGGVANYLTKTADEIDNSKIMLLLASANAYTSTHIDNELHYAFNHDVVVLPYALDETLIPKDFEILLIHANWHYLTKNPIFPTLLTSIAELISKDITSKINLLTLDEEQNIVPKDQAELESPSTEEEMQARLALIEAAKKALEEKLHSAEAQGHQSEKIRFKQVAKQLIWILTITIVLMLPIIFGINRHKAYKSIQWEYMILNDSIAPYTIEVSGLELVNDYHPNEISIPKKIKHNDTTYLVTSIGRDITSITIPEGVTRIQEKAFWGCEAIKSITIPNSVRSIGDFAFYNCSSLLSITIPNSVTTIGKNVFSSCQSLTSLSIPNSVTSLGDWNFENFSSLTYISLPNCVTEIKYAAFKGCESLTSITIPNSVTRIGRHAFEGCTSLTSVTIPNSVTTIGDWAFSDCTSLTSVTIPNSVKEIRKGAFGGCSALSSPIYNIHCFAFMPTSYSGAYTIPNSIKQIAGWAFINCTSLTSVTIPNSVTRIGDWAFWDCEYLESIFYTGTMAQWEEISLGEDWNKYCPAQVVQCTDGEVEL